MRLLRDEVYRLIAVARGDVSSSSKAQEKARESYQALIEGLTRQIQTQAPGDLSITHESVEAMLDAAYRDYRRRTKLPSDL